MIKSVIVCYNFLGIWSCEARSYKSVLTPWWFYQKWCAFCHMFFNNKEYYHDFGSARKITATDCCKTFLHIFSSFVACYWIGSHLVLAKVCILRHQAITWANTVIRIETRKFPTTKNTIETPETKTVDHFFQTWIYQWSMETMGTLSYPKYLCPWKTKQTNTKTYPPNKTKNNNNNTKEQQQKHTKNNKQKKQTNKNTTYIFKNFLILKNSSTTFFWLIIEIINQLELCRIARSTSGTGKIACWQPHMVSVK